jgi:hypothetical protein
MNVDHEFGAAIQRDAVNDGHIPAMSTEKIGFEEFKLKYGGGVKP